MTGIMPDVEQMILVRAVKLSPLGCSGTVLPSTRFMGYISTLLMSLTLPRNFWNWEGGKMLIKQQYI